MPGNLRLYNTLSREKELFKPLKGKKVNFFVCGSTVYDFSHIGHARTYIIFDCFAKYLKFSGYTVYYLQNITDVDDKIIARAREKGVLPKDLALAFEKEHLKDMKALGITSVKKYARATDYIPQIISQVQRLVKKGFAYQLADGMYFDISKFAGYGKLSGRSVLQAEDSISRIDYSADKKNRGDFCLWKFNDGSNNEPSWPAPFGSGRPGWHIEDTAITEKFFGAQYDIHGGARDLIFPHHEAEVAQMEAVSGKAPLAKYWMHTGFLTIEEQKMSKSVGNFIKIDDFLQRYSVYQLRFLIAKNLWRSPMNYSEAAIIEVKSTLEKMEEFLRKLKSQNTKGKNADQNPKVTTDLLKKAREDFYAALDDDFNTPQAFAILFDLIRDVNTILSHNKVIKKEASEIVKFFMEINKIFNIIDASKLKQSTIPTEVKKLLDTRQQHRLAAEWQKADEVRQEIEKYGYTVQDSKEGQVIIKK